MRISSNIVEMMHIIELDEAIQVGGKWICKYMIELNSGTKIYFANIKTKDMIKNVEFTTAAMIRSEDSYVLTPDTLDSKRASILIGIDVKDNEVLSVRQNCLFDFWHYNQEKKQIIGLARRFPELYTDIFSLVNVYVAINSDSVIRQTGVYSAYYMSEYDHYTDLPSFVTLQVFPMYAEYSELELASIGSFILHTRYTKHRKSGQYFMQPATKFVINSENVIVINNQLDMIDIHEFLRNPTIPSDISIIWANPDVVDDTLRIFLEKTPKLYNYIFIGYGYEKTCKLRDRIVVKLRRFE